MTARATTVATALTVALTSGLSAQMVFNQAPQRDTRVTPTGPGMISGVLVTDEATPAPVKRAEVRAIAPGAGVQTVYTDAQGRFEFRNMPLGRYTIEANKPGFVRLAYGARRYDRQGTPVTLSDTQRSQDLSMRMARGAVITGRIVDEFGQPAQGATVSVQAVRMVNGERTLTNVPMVSSIFGEQADDRGVYRLFGLPAGEYVIAARPRSVGTGDIRRMTDAELAAAQQALARPEAQMADIPTPITLGFSQVYYPGVTSAADAATITVDTGEERAGIDFTVALVRTATLEGTVVTGGEVRPEAVQLSLSPARGPSPLGAMGGEAVMLTLIGGTNRRVNPDGSFSYGGVAPGAYTLNARATTETGESLWASADVVVDGQTISGLTLALQRGLTVSGQVTFEADGVDVPTDFSRARIFMASNTGPTIVMARSVGGRGAPPPPTISPDGTFRLRDLIPGRYQMRASFSTPEANWTLKSAIIKGQDVLDFAFDLLPGDQITDAALTFTNQTQQVTGMLSDASGRPAPDYTIVIFPADRALWASSRRVGTARPGTDGRFTVNNLPAGEYRIAALTDLAPEETRDPVLLEELLGASVGFTLGDGETRTQDLRIQ